MKQLAEQGGQQISLLPVQRLQDKKLVGHVSPEGPFRQVYSRRQQCHDNAAPVEARLLAPDEPGFLEPAQPMREPPDDSISDVYISVGVSW